MFDLLHDRLWTLLGIAVATAVLTYGMTFAMKPAYRAEVLLSPVADEAQPSLLAAIGGQLGGLGGLVGAGLGSNSRTNEWVAMLTSRSLARQFIAENDLVSWFCSDKVIECDSRREAGADPSEREANDALHLFLRRVLGVSEDKRSGLVRVSVTWFDRRLAADWANRYVALANGEIQRRAVADSRRRIKFLHDAADDAQLVGLREATYRLMETEIKTIMVATTRPDFAFRVIDEASVPDERERVRPLRSVLALAGGLAGGLLAMFVLWFRTGRGTGGTVERTAYEGGE